MSVAREAACQALLDQAGWGAARRVALAGDASSRRYDRLWRGDRSAVLMDAPGAEGVAEFLAIGAHLRGLGLSAPQVMAADPVAGFLLLEDLGDALYTSVIAADPGLELALAQAAAEVLVHLQAAGLPAGVPSLSAADWAGSVALAVTDYAGTGEAGPLCAAMAAALGALADGPRVLILRDFHAGNLIWLPGRKGRARVGLLDFQQAQGGQPGYDLISLLQDARRDVPAGVAQAVMTGFAQATGAAAAPFQAACAALGALRALRILGIFAKLCIRDGKPGYLGHLPRVWGQLQGNLAHPALGQVRAVVTATLPAPEQGVIDRIGGLCGTHVSR